MNQVSPEVGSDPAPAHPALRIDGARLWQRLMTLAAIGSLTLVPGASSVRQLAHLNGD